MQSRCLVTVGLGLIMGGWCFSQNGTQSQTQSGGGKMKVKRQFDTLVFSQDLYAQLKPELSFNAKTKKAAQQWQQSLRRKLVRLVGGFPTQSTPLQPEVQEVKELETKTPDGRVVPYRRETVIFQSRENLSVFAYLLTPLNTQTPKHPCVICLPGHGRGVDDIVGINEDGSLRETWGGYQNDFALQCVANGFAALAIEQLGFGHRRDEAAVKRGAGASSCQPAAGAAFLFGQTMVGWRVYDVMRAIDYLQTRPDVDKTRLAVMGISGGGTITLFSAALDTRVKVAVISGYFNTFKDSIMSISHCIDNYVPGILKVAEMPDVAGLIAPRYLFVESGTKDSIFPIEATRKAFRHTKRIYDVFGVPDRIGIEIFDGEHQFWGKKAFEFLKRHL